MINKMMTKPRIKADTGVERVTLEQIEYFVTSVESGSFSGAAERMFVSHSSVSRGVSVLEDELEVKLLDRGRRALVCTEAGEVFYRQAKALMRQVGAMRDSVAEYRRVQKLQVISIGVYAPNFFELCRDFQQTHPKVELIIRQEEQRVAAERLRGGAADMLLTFSYSLPADAGLETLVLERGHFCALASPRHELAERVFLTDRELAARKDILGESPFHADRERRRDRLRDVHSDLLRIKTGNGITILPEHAAVEFGQGCVQIPIRGELTEYQLVLAWRRNNPSRALAEAVAYFRDRLGEKTEE